MAQQRPQTLAEFSKISGVGSHKLAQYGGQFLAEIQADCHEQGQRCKHQPLSQPFPQTRSCSLYNYSGRAKRCRNCSTTWL